MSDVCRLCMSLDLVNNSIFDDDTNTYLKIVACLPIKVTKDDNMPQSICNECLHKLDGFYQFYNRSVDSENRLLLLQSKEKTLQNGVLQSRISSSTRRAKETLKYIEFNHFNDEKNLKEFWEENGMKGDSVYKSVTTQTDGNENLVELTEIKQEKGISSCDEFEDTNFNSVINSKSEQVKKIVAYQNADSSNLERKSEKPEKYKRLTVKIKKLNSEYSVHNDEESEDKVSLKKLKKSVAEIVHEEIHIKSEDLDEYTDEMGVVEPLAKPGNESIVNNDVWNCCVCFEIFDSYSKMLKHYRIHYSNPKIIMDGPDVNFTRNEKSKAYKCNVCHVECSSRAAAVKHLSRHKQYKPYRCSLCEKTFKNPVEILKHGKKAHVYNGKAEGCDSLSPNGRPPPATKRFMCDICDESFVYMKYLLSHRQAAHPESLGRALINRCLHCRREFAHLNSLRRHLRSHSGERNFLCSVCGKSLTSREHLKFHSRIHTGFKPNVCKTCGKGFVKKCNLTLHERVHSGERPHVCSHCGKAFSQRSTLVIHERYHSGVRPYVCTICSKGFVAKGLLSMHLKTSCL